VFGSAILDVGIGLAFVFGLLSLAASGIRETIEGWTKSRAVNLERGIAELLRNGPKDPDPKNPDPLHRALYQNPFVSALYQGSFEVARKGSYFRSHLPSYIPAANFSAAMLDMIVRGQTIPPAGAAGAAAHAAPGLPAARAAPVAFGAAAPVVPPVLATPAAAAAPAVPTAPAITLDRVRQGVTSLQNPSVERAVLSAIDLAGGDLDQARKNLEAWYDSAMDRISGWYKRKTHWFLFWIGLIIAVSANVSTLDLAWYLYRNEAARSAVTAAATEAVQRPAASEGDRVAADSARASLAALNLPLGWSDTTRELAFGVANPMKLTGPRWWLNLVVMPVLGWLLTAIAVTLGAPFWFDVLNRIMVIRSTVKPHEKSPEEASQDRQEPKRRTADGTTGGPGSSHAAAAQAPPAAFVHAWAAGDPDAGVL